MDQNKLKPYRIVFLYKKNYFPLYFIFFEIKYIVTFYWMMTGAKCIRKKRIKKNLLIQTIMFDCVIIRRALVGSFELA